MKKNIMLLAAFSLFVGMNSSIVGADSDFAVRETAVQVVQGLKQAEKAEGVDESKLTFWQRMQKQITIVKSLPATIMGVLKIVTTMPADAKKMSKNLNTIKAGKQTIISGSSVVRVPSAGLGIKGTEMQLKEVRRNDFDQEQLNGWLIIYNTISAVYVTDFFERSVLPFSKKLVSGFKAVEGFFPSLRGYSDVVDKSLEAFAKAVTDLKASSQENIRLQYAQLNKDTELMVEANDEDVDEDME